MIDMFYDYLFNETSIEVFYQNGFIIKKSIHNDYNFIVLDPETGIMRDINTVNNFCGAYSDARRILGVLEGFYRHDNPVGETAVFPVSFWWDGTGKVLITNSANSIAADDELIIIGPDGTITRYYGGMYATSPNIDITKILEPGVNNIQIIVKDLYASMIGCTSLVLVQVDATVNSRQYIQFDPLNFIPYILPTLTAEISYRANEVRAKNIARSGGNPNNTFPIYNHSWEGIQDFNYIMGYNNTTGEGVAIYSKYGYPNIDPGLDGPGNWTTADKVGFIIQSFGSTNFGDPDNIFIIYS